MFSTFQFSFLPVVYSTSVLSFSKRFRNGSPRSLKCCPGLSSFIHHSQELRAELTRTKIFVGFLKRIRIRRTKKVSFQKVERVSQGKSSWCPGSMRVNIKLPNPQWNDLTTFLHCLPWHGSKRRCNGMFQEKRGKSVQRCNGTNLNVTLCSGTYVGVFKLLGLYDIRYHIYG